MAVAGRRPVHAGLLMKPATWRASTVLNTLIDQVRVLTINAAIATIST